MYCAIIIEPRKHKALEFVINNIYNCLPCDIILFHGNNNIEYSHTIVDKLNTNRIKLVQLDVDNLDLIEYSKLLATKSVIYDHIQTDMFLVFQTDSMVFKENAHMINDFLVYDYVGAPWLVTNYHYTKMCGFVGNGGFSLRNKKKMLEIIEYRDWNQLTEYVDRLEDLFVATNYQNINVKKPGYYKACSFCVDEVYYETPIGCHKPWLHPHYELLKDTYPECEILRNLQDVED